MDVWCDGFTGIISDFNLKEKMIRLEKENEILRAGKGEHLEASHILEVSKQREKNN